MIGDDLIGDVLGGLPEPSPDCSWSDVDLSDALAGREPPPPSVGRRVDGAALFYKAAVNLLFGEPASGKGWVTCVAVAQELQDGNPVAYIDLEDSAAGIVGRLLLLGVDPDTIREQFHYKRPTAGLTVVTRALLLAEVETLTPALVVLDGVTEAMSAHDLSPDTHQDVAEFFALLPRPVADLGAAVALLDHVTKSKETRGRWAIGSGHKLAMVDGTALSVEPITAFARGVSGRSKLVVAKDRTGYLRRGETVAELVVDADPDGGVRVTLEQSDAVDADGNFRPTTIMGRVSEWLEGVGDWASTKRVKVAVTGKGEVIPLALRQLEREDYVESRQQGAATEWRSIRGFNP